MQVVLVSKYSGKAAEIARGCGIVLVCLTLAVVRAQDSSSGVQQLGQGTHGHRVLGAAAGEVQARRLPLCRPAATQHFACPGYSSCSRDYI